MSFLPSPEPKDNIFYEIVTERQVSKNASVRRIERITLNDRPHIMSVNGKDIKNNLIMTMAEGYFSDRIEARRLLKEIDNEMNLFNFNWEGISSYQMDEDYTENWYKLVRFFIGQLNTEWVIPYYISEAIARYSLDLYGLTLLKIELSAFGADKNDYNGLSMYSIGKVPVDFQTMVPLDDRWIDSMELTHTFDVVRHTTSNWIKEDTKFVSERFELLLEERKLKEEEEKGLEL